ncbi:hypothetical protein, partial [Helicobacter sp. MIT 14-3879]|uniref:hypothetical protein n=1 Tax=Helicobacter sp. MIT 14-3879 TaxID=2040649 RepID=UPI000E1E7B35
IWEVKDMCSGEIGSETSILERIKRLLKKVIESFKTTFLRGASFGVIDIAMGIIGQIFTSIASSLKRIWEQLRNSSKSIFNAIHSYIQGKITSFRDLLSAILKGLFSATWVISTIVLEKELETMLPFGVFLAPAFAIVTGAFAVVITSRSIDLALDSLFGVFARAEIARKREEEISLLIAQKLPFLIEKREELERIIAQTHRQRLLDFNASFSDYQDAITKNDEKGIFYALNQINAMWGAELKIKDIGNVKEILQNTNRTGKLQW